jgi:Ricin-type beta-trefoil lectin domain
MLTLSHVCKYTLASISTTAIVVNGLIFPHSAEASLKNSQFSIEHKGSGLILDIFGDNSPRTKTKIHLWDHLEKSNLFQLGPDENSGNEIRSVQEPEVCLGTDGDTNSEPAPGTPLIAKRDCANSFNFKYDGQSWHVGKFPNTCIDINQNKAEKWEPVQLHPCNGSPAQQFVNPLGSNEAIQAAKPFNNGQYNSCFEIDRDEQRDEDGEFIIHHHNNCGDYYVYISPKKAIDFSRDIKNSGIILGLGEAGIAKYPILGPFAKAVQGVFAIGFGGSYGIAINDLDACSSKGKNAWFRTKENGTFPSSSCD